MLRILMLAIRSLSQRRRLTVSAVLVLAPAIGFATAAFTYVDLVFFRPFPYAAPDRLALVWSKSSDPSARPGVSGPNLRDWREGSNTCVSLVPLMLTSVQLGMIDAQRVAAAYVGADMFSALGVQPAHGRPFRATDTTPGAKVAILSSSLWHEQFGGERETSGQTIVVNGETYAVAGVMPQSFFFPDTDVRLWLALPDDFPGLADRGTGLVMALARLRDGATLRDTENDLGLISSRLESAYPSTNRGLRARVTSLREVVVARHETAAWVIAAAVAMVLAMACVNVALLLAGSATVRVRICAIRAALGATRRTLTTELMAEYLLLAVVSAAAGLLFTRVALYLLSTTGAGNVLQLPVPGLDVRVLAFALAAAVLTSVAFGTVPALSLSRSNLTTLMNRGANTGGQPRARVWAHLLVGVQVAVAVALVAVTALLVGSFQNLVRADWGFRPEKLVAIDVALPSRYRQQAAEQAAFTERALRSLQQLPAASSVAMAFGIPTMWEQYQSTFLRVDGRLVATREWTPVTWVVSPGYFSTLQIPIVRGREFSAGDDGQATRVVVVSQSLARALWPGQEAVGRHVTVMETRREGGRVAPAIVERMRRHDSSLFTDPSVWTALESGSREVIGVVGDVRMFGLDFEPPPALYVDSRQQLPSHVFVGSLTPKFVVRASDDVRSLAAVAAKTVKTVEPSARVAAPHFLEEAVAASIGGRGSTKLLAALGTMFGGVALWIAAAGIFGALMHAVSMRTREIAIRLAFGAGRADVLRLFGGTLAIVVAIGALVGLGLAAGATRLLQTFLFGVSGREPVWLVVATVVIACAAAAASIIPLRRAVRIDPTTLLRVD